MGCSVAVRQRCGIGRVSHQQLYMVPTVACGVCTASNSIVWQQTPRSGHGLPSFFAQGGVGDHKVVGLICPVTTDLKCGDELM